MKVVRKHKLIIQVLIATAFSVCVFSFVLLQNISAPTAGREVSALTFSVLSDVHADPGKLRKAITDLYFINSETDAMVLNGDITDQGVSEEYEIVQNVLVDTQDLLPPVIIRNIGNHEYFNYNKGRNTLADAINYRNLYLKFTGNLFVYHDTWIKGYHFISLGSESANLMGSNPPNDADLSENQLAWLRGKLKEKRVTGKPIFVFLHQHLKTSVEGWKGVIQEKELTDILSEYPEVILFTSHTHVSLGKDGVLQTEPFTIVNTGALQFVTMGESRKAKRFYGEYQGLYVEVNGRTVVIKGRDFARNEWIFSREITK